MRMTSYFRSLVKSGTLDSSKSFALLLSVIIGAIILLGITHDDVVAYKHPYQNLSFGEALQALEAGKCVRRESWVGDKFVVKQIDSDIPAEVVPKMQSLPDSAKQFIGKTANGDIHYRNQCLIVKQYPSSTVATNYVPDWNDMFAKDWMVL